MRVLKRLTSFLKGLPMDLPNFTYLGHGFYVCRTQAGFKRALKHFAGPDTLATEYRGLISDVSSYPKRYPSFVALSWGYAGYTYIRANCMHLNDIRAALDEADPKDKDEQPPKT